VYFSRRQAMQLHDYVARLDVTMNKASLSPIAKYLAASTTASAEVISNQLHTKTHTEHEHH
jgi:hypothetical protein